jgi:hypothetical protein
MLVGKRVGRGGLLAENSRIVDDALRALVIFDKDGPSWREPDLG